MKFLLVGQPLKKSIMLKFLNENSTINYSEAEIMISKGIDWFEIQEDTNATYIFLRKIWNIRRSRGTNIQQHLWDSNPEPPPPPPA